MSPPPVAPQGGEPEDGEGHQREPEREDVREVAEPEEQVDPHRVEEGGGAVAMAPPEPEDEGEQREAQREVVEPRLKGVVEDEREGQERQPAAVAGTHGAREVPDPPEERQRVGAHQQLLRHQRRHHEHQQGQDGVAEPVRIGLGVDPVVLLEQRVVLDVEVLPEDPGVVGVAGPVHGGEVADDPERRHIEQRQGQEEGAEPAFFGWGLGCGFHRDPLQGVAEDT